jgi:nucleotide-binding universal stress UspA family protein
MYKKILLTLDGSRSSEHILLYARYFAETLKIPVELLQVIEPEALIPLVAGKPDRYHQVLSTERERIGTYLKRIATSFSDLPPVDCSVEVGKAAEVIVDKAAADAGTLIAMTTHGRSGVQRWLLGSVAEKVLHATRNHLLLVRGANGAGVPEGGLLKSVVVPLDGSELAESVIPHVVELAKKMTIEIILVRAFHLPVDDSFGGGGCDDRVLEMVKEDAKSYLEEKVRQLKSKGAERVTSVLLEGFAAGSIIDFAQKTPQNLIAMCTHGRSGVGRWVLGSVTDRVVRHSGDPVLVIPARGATAGRE